MTKEELLYLLDQVDDDDEVDLNELIRRKEKRIEELEERQHMNGFYSEQDKIALYKMER